MQSYRLGGQGYIGVAEIAKGLANKGGQMKRNKVKSLRQRAKELDISPS